MKLRLLASAAVLLSLAACGGGGGGGDSSQPVAAPSITVEALQGFWNGPVAGTSFGGASTVRSVVLSDGSTWVFMHDGQDNLIGLSTAKLSVSGTNFSGSGMRYPASGSRAEHISVSGVGPQNGAWSVSVATGGGTSSLALTYDNRYQTAATPADAIGRWRFTKQGSTIQVTWDISGSGALTGSSTLGCSYSGQVVPHLSVNIYDVTVTENCTNTVKELRGIGRINTAKTFMTFGLTTTDGDQAEAFAAQKGG